MATPVLKCVKREEREKDGFCCFKEWVETPSHIYIGCNIRKYLKDYNKKDSIWCNPFITYDLSREETNKYYETFVRSNPHMIKKLTELKNKVLGCWCETMELCHGQVLIKLYREFTEKLPTLQSENLENKIHPHKKVKIDFEGKGWN